MRRRERRPHLDRDRHLGADETRKVCNHLIGNATRVAADTGTVKRSRAVKSLGLCDRWLHGWLALRAWPRYWRCGPGSVRRGTSNRGPRTARRC